MAQFQSVLIKKGIYIKLAMFNEVFVFISKFTSNSGIELKTYWQSIVLFLKLSVIIRPMANIMLKGEE